MRISNKAPFLAPWCSMIYKKSARRPRYHDAPVTLRVESADVVLHCIWARTRKTLQLTGYPGLVTGMATKNSSKRIFSKIKHGTIWVTCFKNGTSPKDKKKLWFFSCSTMCGWELELLTNLTKSDHFHTAESSGVHPMSSTVEWDDRQNELIDEQTSSIAVSRFP